MTLIETIKRMNENKNMKSQKFKEMQEDDHLQTMLEERKKSANQRELERYMKQMREEQIKKKLDAVHKKQTKEMWKPKHNLLDKGKSLLKDDRPILKEKNIFALKEKSLIQKGGIFFND